MRVLLIAILRLIFSSKLVSVVIGPPQLQCLPRRRNRTTLACRPDKLMASANKADRDVENPLRC
jgi:hypothetical protein